MGNDRHSPSRRPAVLSSCYGLYEAGMMVGLAIGLPLGLLIRAALGPLVDAWNRLARRNGQ